MDIFCKFSPERDKKPLSEPTANWINVLCFYIFGIMAFFNQEMLYTASEDILSGKNLPTATILVSFVTPMMVTKIAAPWFLQKIPYFVKVCFIAMCMALGLTLVVFVEDIKVKLVGIGLNAIGTGMAEISFLALTSFYPQLCISAFVAGTGMASLVSPLYYTGKIYILSRFDFFYILSEGDSFLSFFFRNLSGLGKTAPQKISVPAISVFFGSLFLFSLTD